MTKFKLIGIIILSVAVLTFTAGCKGGGTAAGGNAAPAVNFSGQTDKASAAEKDVSVEETLNLWRDKQAVVIDVRTPAEYREGHIPGVANIPLEELEQRFGEIPKDKKVLLICRSGRRSAQGVDLLRGKGFDNVFNVVQGMLAWTGPVEK